MKPLEVITYALNKMKGYMLKKKASITNIRNTDTGLCFTVETWNKTPSGLEVEIVRYEVPAAAIKEVSRRVEPWKG